MWRNSLIDLLLDRQIDEQAKLTDDLMYGYIKGHMCKFFPTIVFN